MELNVIIVKDSYWMHPVTIHSASEITGVLMHEVSGIGGSIYANDAGRIVTVTISKDGQTVYTRKFDHADYASIKRFNPGALEVDILYESVNAINSHFDTNLSVVIPNDKYCRKTPLGNNVPQYRESPEVDIDAGMIRSLAVIVAKLTL